MMLQVRLLKALRAIVKCSSNVFRMLLSRSELYASYQI